MSTVRKDLMEHLTPKVTEAFGDSIPFLAKDIANDLQEVEMAIQRLTKIVNSMPKGGTIDPESKKNILKAMGVAETLYSKISDLAHNTHPPYRGGS